MWLGSGITVAVAKAGSCSSDLSPSLGTFTCHRCGPNTKKINRGKCQIYLKKKRNHIKFVFFFFWFFFFFFMEHIEVPKLAVKSELQLPVCTTATATGDPSLICNLCHGLQQCQILNPLSKARDQTLIFSDTISGS